jgi:hypothetical protein
VDRATSVTLEPFRRLDAAFAHVAYNHTKVINQQSSLLPATVSPGSTSSSSSSNVLDANKFTCRCSTNLTDNAQAAHQIDIEQSPLLSLLLPTPPSTITSPSPSTRTVVTKRTSSKVWPFSSFESSSLPPSIDKLAQVRNSFGPFCSCIPNTLNDDESQVYLSVHNIQTKKKKKQKKKE